MLSVFYAMFSNLFVIRVSKGGRKAETDSAAIFGAKAPSSFWEKMLRQPKQTEFGD